MSDFISELSKLTPVLAPLVTFVVGYYGARVNRQNNLNNDQTRLEGIYAGTQKELLMQINQLTRDKLDLANDIVSLREQISKLQDTVNDLTSQIDEYKEVKENTSKK